MYPEVAKTTLSQIFPLERRLVSYTTRHPRPGEIDGIDYYFVTKKQSEEIKNSANSLKIPNFLVTFMVLPRMKLLKKAPTGDIILYLLQKQGFYKDVSIGDDGQFLYKEQYPIRPVIVKAENHKIIEAIKERGGEEANQRILNLAKEEKTIVDLLERFPNLEVFDVMFDDGIVENQKRFKDFLGLSQTK